MNDCSAGNPLSISRIQSVPMALPRTLNHESTTHMEHGPVSLRLELRRNLQARPRGLGAAPNASRPQAEANHVLLARFSQMKNPFDKNLNTEEVFRCGHSCQLSDEGSCVSENQHMLPKSCSRPPIASAVPRSEAMLLWKALAEGAR